MPIIGILVPKGALRVTLTWPKATRPDLDLHVVEPNGIEIYWGRKNHAQCDSRLDLDANAMCPATGLAINREVYNAYLPIAGDYQVKVDYHDDCDHTGAASYTVKIEGCGTSWQTTKNTPAAPDHGVEGSGELAHSFHCEGHYWVEGKAKYLYWKMRNHTAAGDTGILADVPFKLYDHNNAEIAVTPNSKAVTSSTGLYKAAFELNDALAQHAVTLKFLTDDSDVAIYELKHNAADAAPHCCTGDADKIHTFAHPTTWVPKTDAKKKLPLMTIPLHDSAGFHTFRQMKAAKKYYKTLFTNWNTSYPKVEIETLAGEDPSCGSCFAPATNRFYLMGDHTSDQDYYDDGVMLHELGHFVMAKAAFDHSPGGAHSWSSQLVPEFAWSEGIATYLAQSIIESRTAGQGKWYCDRTASGDNCKDFTLMSGVPKGTDNSLNTGKRSEALTLALLWDMRDSDNDGGKDPVNISETAFLKWVFDKSAANKTKTMQDAANWDKGTNAKTDGSDLIHLYGCPLTEATTPKKSELKKLMKDRFTLEWLDEASFCP
jgi:hypothetical protein